MSLHDLHRPLGNTGLIVSPLGLGTVKLGRDQGVKYPNGFTIPDDAAARALLDQARALGINLIDTAPAYGVSEQRLGPLLRGQREDWVIVSKVGEEFDNGQSRFDFSPAHTRLSVERSLQRLETDRIDLVLVHSDGNDVAILRDSVAVRFVAIVVHALRLFCIGGEHGQGDDGAVGVVGQLLPADARDVDPGVAVLVDAPQRRGFLVVVPHGLAAVALRGRIGFEGRCGGAARRDVVAAAGAVVRAGDQGRDAVAHGAVSAGRGGGAGGRQQARCLRGGRGGAALVTIAVFVLAHGRLS